MSDRRNNVEYEQAEEGRSWYDSIKNEFLVLKLCRLLNYGTTAVLPKRWLTDMDIMSTYPSQQGNDLGHM